MSSQSKKQRDRRLIRKTIRLLEGRCCEYCVYSTSDPEIDKLFCNLYRNVHLEWEISHGKRDIKIDGFHMRDGDDCCDKFKRRHEKEN
jgi:hypothetical protein